jgi:hypothetical protein
MDYFHSHYCPIVFKASLLFGKHKPIKACDEVKKAPVDINLENPGKHDNDNLFGPDVKRKRKRK